MKVLIGTPAHDGKVVCDYCINTAEIFRINAQENRGYDLHLYFMMYQSMVQAARNDIFYKAYTENYDALVFIDADQSFKTETFFRLLKHPVDVVGVPVPMKQMDERYNIRPDDPKKHKWDKNLDLLVVECIGTGFIKYSRKAIEVLWDNSESYGPNNENRLICNYRIYKGGIIGEDIDICYKLEKAGIPIYVDIEDTCSHFGTHRFDGNYQDYLIKNSLESA